MSAGVNAAAENALKTYLGMDEPGYALMVDAPWGAGKTHFARSVCEANRSETSSAYRYVSLNGVADADGFRAALLAESYLSDSKLNGAAKIGQDLAGMIGFSGSVDVVRGAAEAHLFGSLPDILVFDDLERAVWPFEEMFGAINRFVEHEGKRVVLLVNSDEVTPDEQKRKEQFLKRREKLVGRVLHISADVGAAYPHFLEKMAEGRGKTYLTEHEPLTCGVFKDAGHANLRVFRTALRECALVLNQLEDRLFEAESSMARFVRTYLALSMALCRGELSITDLENRTRSRYSNRKEGSEGNIVFQISERHKDCDILDGQGSVFAATLDRPFFVSGVCDWSDIRATLEATKQFSNQGKDPVWERLRWWRTLVTEGRAGLFEEAREYAFEKDDVDISAMLHVGFHLGFLDNSCRGVSGRQDVYQALIERLRKFGQEGKIQGVALGQKSLSSIDCEKWWYVGMSLDVTPGMEKVLAILAEEETLAFERRKPEILRTVMQRWETDLSRFQDFFVRDRASTNFHRTPILHELDVGVFAERLAGRLADGHWNDVEPAIELLIERHRQEGNWSQEQLWAQDVRMALEVYCKELSPIDALPIRDFLAQCWNFEVPATA